MTKSELDSWRKRAPWFIFTIGLSLYFIVVNGASLESAKSKNDLLGAVIAATTTFFYVGLGIRNYLWKREMNAHVGNQIREALLQMIPADLGVTEEEKKALAEREVYKNLTGVFWEAVDNDEQLRSHKEHFYSNGITYSTSIDVFIIGLILGFAYIAAALIMGAMQLLLLGGWCIAIALLSRSIVTPMSRKRHLDLSAEQLELLRRRQSEFVSTRFRQIVRGWRSQREESLSKTSVG